MKAYFNISNLFNDSDVNNGCTFSLYLKSIKVDGTEQLTTDYFSEVTSGVFINPHTSNAWEFSNCTQSGTFPNTTTINACNLGGTPNSFNPFADAFKVNYSDTVNGVKRGEITTSISGNSYGLEQFKFGFDKITVPINDVAGGSNGSTGASIDGAFYLEIDTTKDFLMEIEVKKRSDSNVGVSSENHIFSHESSNCEFDYNIESNNYNIVSESYFWESPIDAAHWSFVDAENGFAYSSAGRTGSILKLEISTGVLSTFGSFTAGVSPQYKQGIYNPIDNKIYFMPYESTSNGVLVLDVSNDTYTEFGAGSFTYFPNQITITPTGVIYGTTNNSNQFLKIDTNTNTVTDLFLSGANGGGSANYSNGFVYFINGVSSSGEFYKLDVSNDNISTVLNPLITSSSFDSVMGSDGIIYTVGNDGSFAKSIKLETLNSDNITEINITNVNPLFFSSVNQMSDGNVYFINNFDFKVYKLDVETGGADEVYSLSGLTQFSLLDPTTIGDSIYGIQTPENSQILKLDFEFAADSNGKQISFLSGGDSGWIVPDCNGDEENENCDCIVTQSIGILASKRKTTISLFEEDKECCYFSPVFGDVSDTVSYKNDINSFLFKRDLSSETIDFVLLKNGGAANGGSDIPLVDNTYGVYYNFGSLANQPDYKGYKVEWRNVLTVQGEGSYQIQVTSNFITGPFVETSIPFKLQAYTAKRVKGTVRIQSIMNGYLRNTDFDYTDLEWLDGIRFEGMFGNRQAEYEEERIIFNDKTSRQLRSELLNTYSLKSLHLPSCITDIVLDYHNLSNKMLITDYNSINHKTYIDTEVVLDKVNELAYPVVANTAPLDINYKDYLQNFDKSNC